MRDKRQYPRVTLRISAWCESEAWTERTAIVDASKSGLRVRGCRAQPAGSRLKVSFRDPDGHAVVATVEVVWSADGRRSDTGLKIVELHEGERVLDGILAAHGA